MVRIDKILVQTGLHLYILFDGPSMRFFNTMSSGSCARYSATFNRLPVDMNLSELNYLNKNQLIQNQ
jgi:hypothetical protein